MFKAHEKSPTIGRGMENIGVEWQHERVRLIAIIQDV